MGMSGAMENCQLRAIKQARLDAALGSGSPQAADCHKPWARRQKAIPCATCCSS